MTSVAPSPADSVQYAIDNQLAYQVDGPTDFVFMIHVAHVPGQRLVEESLQISPYAETRVHTDVSGNRVLRLSAAAGTLHLHYRATVERGGAENDSAAREVPVAELPDDVLPHLLPTRYCESDLLANAALKLFGDLPKGYARVQAITDWVATNIEYRLGSSVATTTARDIFVQRAGVCRDFAHLAITLCRALNIPARLVCGYAKFDSPPPDFHAVFEAYLGNRWMLFDPTGLAPVQSLIRIATGRDAKDVAFATIFGPSRMTSMQPDVLLLPSNPSADPTPVGKRLQPSAVFADATAS